MYNILIISGEALKESFIRNNCNRVFESSFQLDYASKGREAIDFLFDRNYDLILVDNKLVSTITEEFLVLFLKTFSADVLLVAIGSNIQKHCVDGSILQDFEHIVDESKLQEFLTNFSDRRGDLNWSKNGHLNCA